MLEAQNELLTHVELAKIEQGLPDLAEWGSQIRVPFKARRLKQARVVWLNKGWLIDRGIDATDQLLEARLTRWIIDRFAFSVAQPGQCENSYTDEERVFHADRYGGSGLEAHGGSGRAGIAGRFQVKGIGPTPLVGLVDEWSYSHGCIWLEEAVREAIYSELIRAEFPCGAVPVLAVIDSGLNYKFADGKLGERCALIVRPMALRMAHLQRSVMFHHNEASVGESASDDGLRVREAVKKYNQARCAPEGLTGLAPSISALLERTVDQVAFGRVHRLFLGGFFSSSVTLAGELIDFGSTRTVADWSKALANDHVPGFGDELYQLADTVKSLVMYHNKHVAEPAEKLCETELVQSITARLSERCAVECLKLWGVEDVLTADDRRYLLTALDNYFSNQQRLVVSYEHALRPVQGWLYDAMAGNPAAGTVEVRTLAVIQDALKRSLGKSSRGRLRRKVSNRRAMRLLRPRPELDREVMQCWLHDQIGGATALAAPDPQQVEYAIDNRLTIGRRHWPHVPSDLVVEAQAWTSGTCMLACFDPSKDRGVIWIEAARKGDELRLFDRWLPQDALRSFEVRTRSHRWCGRFPVKKEDRFGMPPSIAARGVQGPSFTMRYF